MEESQERKDALFLSGILIGLVGGVLGNFFVTSYYAKDFLTFFLDFLVLLVIIIVFHRKISQLLKKAEEQEICENFKGQHLMRGW
jgi:uncharacterized membrane protein YfcA